MWGRFVGRIKESFELLKLMRPIAKLRIAILGIFGLASLILMGWLFGYICWTYILYSILAVVMYIIIIVLETLKQ